MSGVAPPTKDQIESDLARLEAAIRELKTQYDMFFNGALPRQPYELRADVERLIKRYANTPPRKYAHRFHLNSLVSRYNSLSELWSKTLRTLEEGARLPALRSKVGEVLARCRIQDPTRDQELLRLLHQNFVEARRRLGLSGSIPFSRFVECVAGQAEALQRKTGCRQVELRIILDEDAVRLKARPVR